MIAKKQSLEVSPNSKHFAYSKTKFRRSSKCDFYNTPFITKIVFTQQFIQNTHKSFSMGCKVLKAERVINKWKKKNKTNLSL